MRMVATWDRNWAKHPFWSCTRAGRRIVGRGSAVPGTLRHPADHAVHLIPQEIANHVDVLEANSCPIQVEMGVIEGELSS
jgi:hypothetical protein